MDYRPLGRTGIRVSSLSLGTMTFGCDTDEAEAHRMLDLAVDRGVNHFDTAELYPVPPDAERAGAAETILGNWLAARGGRDRIVVATKVVGPPVPGEGAFIRGGRTGLDRASIRAAIEGSLRRLRTDHVDLYQLHWPARHANFFGRLNYRHEPDDEATPIRETLEALAGLVAEGKVRAIGLSNETPWGVMEFLRLAERHDLPRAAAIQNPYSLLNRSFEVGLAEMACREDVGLLAYSPTACGTLTGKYLDDPATPGKMVTMKHYFFRYAQPRCPTAIADYVAAARAFGIAPAKMAIAFARTRPFVTGVILGASNAGQLSENLDAHDTVLPEALIERIDALYDRHQCVAA